MKRKTIKPETCPITGLTLEYYNTVTTIEGVKLHNIAYNTTVNKVRKGLITLKEAVKVFEEREGVIKATNNYILLLRKKALHEGNNKLAELYKERLKAEKEFCETFFKKERETVTPEEYLQLLEEFSTDLEQYSSIRIPEDDSYHRLRNNMVHIKEVYPPRRVREIYIL